MTGEASSSSGRRRLAVHREGGSDRGGVVILREAEARGPPGGRAGPGKRRHPPGGGGSRSTGREGGTREASSSSRRRRLAVYREGGWDRGGVVIFRAAEARGPPGVRAGPRRRRHPPGGGGTRSTEREGGTGEASSSSWRRTLAVHREGGRDRGGVLLREAEARGPPGGRSGPGRCRHPPGGGASRSTGREGGTRVASSSSGQGRLAVHRERGRDRGGVVILRAAEARGPPGGSSRVGLGKRRHSPGGGGSRSTGKDGRLAVQREGGWDRGGVVILMASEARGPPGGRVGPGRRHPPGGGGSRSTGREGETGMASSSSVRRKLAVHLEGGRDRGGVILGAAEERGPPGGRVGPGRRRHPQGCGGSAVHPEGGWVGEAS